MINTKYYKAIQTKTVKHPTNPDINYIGYASKFGCPLILYSETENTPLFLIETLYKNKNMYDKNFSLFSNINYNGRGGLVVPTRVLHIFLLNQILLNIGMCIIKLCIISYFLIHF